MRSGRLILASLALALAAGGLSGASPASVDEVGVIERTIGVLGTPNRTKARRSAATIDQVVVHVTEGSFWGSVRWLRNPHARGSSHFVVSREGEIVQMVDLSDVAWHAGNRWTNRRSIGIEHEGYTRSGGFTDAQYEASAQLLGFLSRRLQIPLDRAHVIGHDEVPHPSGRGRGGVNHHTDPGRFWRWDRYLELARDYAEAPLELRFVPVAPPEPPPAVAPAPLERVIVCGKRRSVHFSTLEDGQKLSSLVPWRAKACGRRITRVEFLVDGELVGRDSVWPFMLAGRRGLNTTELVNGWHTLTLRAYAPHGHRVRKSIRVRVANSPFAVAPAGLGAGQAVSGAVRFRGWTTAPAASVELALGGEVVATAAGRGALEWDSASVPDGEHELELRAVAADGRTAIRSFPVLVTNEEPAPGTARPPHVLWQSLGDWQTVGGPVVWRALADGDIQQVEFFVDGRLRWVAKEPPFAFGGELGLWDPSSVRPGRHQLAVRVVGAGARVAESRVTVFVPASGS